ncbi:ANTAR domain-containing response regulator [Streptomyces mexicanus]|uniref:ANTAR domain-containing response regulator n=1 Tax=Streptomyces mexicanus TaxID=178566 RepID=UPI00364F15A3
MILGALPPVARRLHTLADALVVDVTTHPDGRAVLTVRGELVHGCTDTLAKTLAQLPPQVRRIDLRMAEVRFMDTAGLEFLDALHEHGRRHLVPVTATGWTGQPLRILELAGLDTTDPLNPSAGAPADGPADGPPHGPVAGPPDGPDPHLPGPAPAVCSAVAVERAERLTQLQQEVEQLRRAIVSRPVIDQARGILMAAHVCTAQQAWDILRVASQRSNTKLRTVAAAVTEGARPGGTPPPEEIRTALRTAVALITSGTTAPPAP